MGRLCFLIPIPVSISCKNCHCEGQSKLIKLGTITEYSKLGQNIVIAPSDYQELPLEDRWMAYPTVNAVEFFQIWERKYETLSWMVVYHKEGKAATALWYSGSDMNTDLYEDSAESDDESYVPDSEEEFSSSDDEYEWDSEYESETEYDISDGEDSSEYQESKTELQWLKGPFQQDSSDAPGGIIKQQDMKMLVEQTMVSDIPNIRCTSKF